MLQRALEQGDSFWIGEERTGRIREVNTKKPGSHDRAEGRDAGPCPQR